MDDPILWLTFVLVAITAYYAKLTRDIAKATADSADTAHDAARAAEASAQHAARAIGVTERAALAQSMPLLVAVLPRSVGPTTGSDEPTVRFEIRNVGHSTALNGMATYNNKDHPVQLLPAGKAEERARRDILFEWVTETSWRVKGPVVILYEDAVGNRFKTVSELHPHRDMPTHETSVWLAGGWQSLRAELTHASRTAGAPVERSAQTSAEHE